MSSADLDGVATFYNLIFRKPVGRHVIMVCDSVSCWIMGYERMREHLTHAAGNPVRRDHARQPLHAAADRLPRCLRSCAGHDGGRRSARRSRSAEDRQAARGVQVAMTDGKAAHPAISRPTARRLWTCGPTSRPGATRRLRKALREMTPQSVQRGSQDIRACAAAAAPAFRPG